MSRKEHCEPGTYYWMNWGNLTPSYSLLLMVAWASLYLSPHLLHFSFPHVRQGQFSPTIVGSSGNLEMNVSKWLALLLNSCQAVLRTTSSDKAWEYDHNDRTSLVVLHFCWPSGTRRRSTSVTIIFECLLLVISFNHFTLCSLLHLSKSVKKRVTRVLH